MGSKSNGIDQTDWVRTPPTSGPFCVRLAKAIYDPADKTFLGRTAKRWGIVVAFYLVFYAVLGAMFGICMAGLYATLRTDRPSYTLDRSLIGSNPGVACRPRPVDPSQVIRYNVQNASQSELYTAQLDEYLAPYLNSSWYPVKSECTAEENYGFPYSPCFFIKLNKIIDWMPEYYSDDTSLPEEMPDDLQEHIKSLTSVERQQVWVSCSSEGAQVQYPWERGLGGRFYPFVNLPGYISPLVPVRITPTVNTLVSVRCWAWARNIRRNKSLKEPSGYTSISIYIEDFTSEAAANVTA